MHFMRKYAKPILAVMGVVCMITFVVGPYLLDLVSGGRGGSDGEYKDPIALTWAKGSVRESDLYLRRMRHIAAANFLAAVISETIQRGGRPVVNGQAIVDQRTLQQVGIGIPTDSSDPTLVNTMLMAEEARRLGIVVDREAVKSHLKQLSAPELGEADWAELLNNVLSDNRLSPDDVLDQLGYELAAQHARRILLSAGMEAIPPGKMWDYFNRLNRRVAIEAYPLDVQPLVASVKGEPTSAEIQKIWEQGRFRDPNPNWHEPGFRKPHKVAFEYVKVDFKPFLDEAMKKITDEEVKKQYELDIAQGKHKDLELPPASSPTPDTPQSEDKKTDPAEAKPSETKPTDQKPADEKPADPKPAEAKADPAEPPAPECQEAAPAAKAPDAAAQDKPVEKASDKPVTDKPATDKPAETPPAEAKTADAQSTEAKPQEGKTAEKAEPKPQKFKPLEAVKEDIRKELAQPIARAASDKAVEELKKEINSYGNLYRRWLTRKEALKGKVDPKSEPAKLNLAAEAARHGFTTGTIPLMDRFEVATTEIGKNVSSFDFASGQLQMLQFADIAYGQDQPLYSVQEANSIEPDVSYLYYRTAEEPGGETTLAEARPQVIEAWKEQKAYELALEEAKKKLADPKAKAAKSLAEFVTDPAKVITPLPFSWLTTSSLPFGFGMPEPSRVNGIDLSGREFMQAVFALELGEMGVAPNDAHSKVYLVKVLSQEPDEQNLRNQFLESGSTPQVAMVAREDMSQTFMDMYRGLEDRYQVKWQRPPFNQRRG
jgi:hypothetical protein